MTMMAEAPGEEGHERPLLELVDQDGGVRLAGGADCQPGDEDQDDGLEDDEDDEDQDDQDDSIPGGSVADGDTDGGLGATD